MKYLFVLSIFLFGCSTVTKNEVKTYKCTIFNMHGTYAHLKVNRSSIEEAIETTETVRNRLSTAKVIPEGCSSDCVSETEKE